MTRASTLSLRRDWSDRKRRLVTPEGLELPLTIGSRGARAAAILIDIMLIGFVSISAVVAALWLGLNLTDDIDDGAGEFLFIIIVIGWFLAWNGYFMLLEMGPRGATIGKRLMRLRVASRDGGRLSPESVIARNLVRDIEIFLPFTLINMSSSGEYGAAGTAASLLFIIFALLPVFNRDALRAGDIIAGTWVVVNPKSHLVEALSERTDIAVDGNNASDASYVFSDDDLSIYGQYELQTLERVIRDDNPKTKSEVAEAIIRRLGWTPGEGDEDAFLGAFYSQLRDKLERDMRFGIHKADKHS